MTTTTKHQSNALYDAKSTAHKFNENVDKEADWIWWSLGIGDKGMDTLGESEQIQKEARKRGRESKKEKKERGEEEREKSDKQ